MAYEVWVATISSPAPPLLQHQALPRAVCQGPSPTIPLGLNSSGRPRLIRFALTKSSDRLQRVTLAFVLVMRDDSAFTQLARIFHIVALRMQ